MTVVVSIASMLIFVPASPLASTFLGCQALGFAAGLVVSFVLSRQLAGEWLARPALYREPLGGLMSMGGWQFVAQGGALIASQADRYLLGAFLAPQFVGYYTIAQRLEEAIYIGVLKVGEILFPFFTALQGESSERKADLLFRSSWVLNVLAASALGGLIPVAGPLLYLWTGAEVAAQAERVLVVLSIAGMLGCTTNAFAFYLLAIGRTRSNAIISFVTAALHADHQRVGVAVFRMAGGGLECLRRHGCPERHHDYSDAAKFRSRRNLVAGGSFGLAAVGHRHRHGVDAAEFCRLRVVRSVSALVVSRLPCNWLGRPPSSSRSLSRSRELAAWRGLLARTLRLIAGRFLPIKAI